MPTCSTVTVCTLKLKIQAFKIVYKNSYYYYYFATTQGILIYYNYLQSAEVQEVWMDIRLHH